MKRNALIRIIIWSITLMVLVSILFVGLYAFRGRQLSNKRPAATAIPVPLTTTPATEAILNAAATVDVNIRKSPSMMSEAIGMLEAGEMVIITKTENVNGQRWSQITFPVQGWVVNEYLVDVDYPDETIYIPNNDPEGKDTFHASEIRELEIQWVAGDILIQPNDTDQIRVTEDGVTDPNYAMVLKKDGSTLEIDFCRESKRNIIGFGASEVYEKDLTITVPRDWICESLEIECASAAVEVNDMTIREVDFDGASGTCEFENCTVGEIDIDTASGDVRFVGNLSMLDCDAASANIYAVLTETPSRMDMDTMSGDLDITLPYDAGFSLSMDAINGDFESDFETTMKNGNYVCGDGRCRINVDALSGDVIIRRAEPPKE